MGAANNMVRVCIEFPDRAHKWLDNVPASHVETVRHFKERFPEVGTVEELGVYVNGKPRGRFQMCPTSDAAVFEKDDEFLWTNIFNEDTKILIIKKTYFANGQLTLYTQETIDEKVTEK